MSPLSNPYLQWWINFPQGYLLLNAEGEVVHCNERACEILNYPLGTLVQKPKLALFEPNVAFAEYVECLREQGFSQKRLLAHKGDGTDVEVQVQAHTFEEAHGAKSYEILIFEPSTAVYREDYDSFLKQSLGTGLMVHDMRGKVIDYNSRAIEYLFMPATFPSMPLMDGVWPSMMYIDQALQPLAPEDLPLAKVLSSHRPVKGMIMGVAHAGVTRWLVVNAHVQAPHSSNPLVVQHFVDISDQLSFKEALAKSTEQLEETHAQARLGSWEYFPATQQMNWSKMTWDIHEMPYDFVPNVETGINFYTEGESRENIIRAFSKLLEDGTPYTLDLQIQTAKGRIIWVRATGHCEFKEGVCRRVFGTFQDIDDRKRKELELSEKQAELTQIYNTISDVVFKLQVEGVKRYRFVTVNEAFCRTTGYRMDEVLNRCTNEIIPEPSLSLVHEMYAKAIAEKTAVEWEETTTFNGVSKTGIVRVSPLFDNAGKCTHLIGNIHDITELKQANLAFEASLNELNHQKFALDQHFIVAVTDLQGSLIYVNDKFCEVSGYSREELLGQNHRMINSGTHPKSFFAEMYKTIYAGKVWQGDICNRRKDGSFYWVRTTIVPFEDAQTKKLSQFIAIRTDITQERATLDALKEREDYLRTIYDYAFTAIMVGDDQGRYIDANNYACELFGYSREELLQMKVSDLQVVNSIPAAELYSNYLHKGIEEGEFHFINGKGKKIVTLYQAVHIRENFNLSVLVDVTDRVESERKIQTTQQLLQEAFNTVSDVIYVLDVEADGRLKYASINKAFMKYTGMSINDRLHHYVDEVIPSPLKELELQHYQRAIESGSRVEFEEMAEYPTGKRFTIVSCTPLMDATGKCFRLVCSARDITDIIDSQNEIRKLSLIARETINAAIITDTQGRITWVNKAFESISGYSSEEILGKKPGEFLQGKETDPQTIAYMRQQLDARQPFEVEVVNYHRSGQPYWIKIQCQPLLGPQGQLEGYFAIETDITNDKEIRLEREILIKELTEHNNDLKQFTYITSHNLRAPLTNLLAISNLLELPPDTDEFTLQLIEGFKNSTFRLNETLEDLIRILLIKESPHVEVADVDFRSTIEKVEGSLQMLLSESQANVHMDFSKAPSVVFSPAYMESIFLNLLSNSIKYRNPKLPLEINIRSKRKGAGVEVVYSDNGIGFDLKRVKERVFGLYQRFHNNTDGKGVGLYLIKSQLNALGGQIDVQSEEGMGTTFTLTFKG